MSGKLDQSLDAIISTGKTTGRGRGRRVAGRGTGRQGAAPAGGIKKGTSTNTRATRSTAKQPASTGSAGGSGDSKVIVSNLPTDVSESHVKEYFHATIGPVKRVQLTYGPNGTSRGIATVVFGRFDGATKALKQLNGVLVDNRPLKIEVVLDASRAPMPAPIKALSERVAANRQNKPKSAAEGKATTNGTANGTRGPTARGRGGRARGRNAGRAKPKTADELDAEMNDYFDAPTAVDGAGSATNGIAAVAPATIVAAADTGMEDEIM